MKTVALLPVLFVLLVGATPANAWTWPADGPVLQQFHLGDDPYAAGQHRGIDVAGASGSAARAPAGGIVSFAGSVPGGGRTVTIRTDDGYAVTLLHLGAIGVRRGTAVAEGATVGTVGSSGTPEHDEPYVHLGVRRAADPHGYVDPLTLLPPRAEPEAEPEAEPAPAAAPEVPAEASVPGAGEEAPAEAPAAPPPAPAPASAPVAAAAGAGQPAAQSEAASEAASDSRTATEQGARAPGKELTAQVGRSLPASAERQSARPGDRVRGTDLRLPARSRELPAPIRLSERALLEGGSEPAQEPVAGPEARAEGRGPGAARLVGAGLAFILLLGGALAAAARSSRLHRDPASPATPVSLRSESSLSEALGELEAGPAALPLPVSALVEPCRLEPAWLGAGTAPLGLHEITRRHTPRPRPGRPRQVGRSQRVHDPLVAVRRRSPERSELHAVSIR